MGNKDEKARRNQIIVGLIVGLIVGGLMWWLTTFWMWMLAGVVLGFVSGVLIKPPTDKQPPKNKR